MGFLKDSTKAQSAALDGFDDPALEPLWEQARAAKLASRKTYVARMPLPSDAAASGDVPFWSAAVHQIARQGWSLQQWSVCPEPGGPVAYAVFVSD